MSIYTWIIGGMCYHRKWTWEAEFKSWMKFFFVFSFHFMLMSFGKVKKKTISYLFHPHSVFSMLEILWLETERASKIWEELVYPAKKKYPWISTWILSSHHPLHEIKRINNGRSSIWAEVGLCIFPSPINLSSANIAVIVKNAAQY